MKVKHFLSLILATAWLLTACHKDQCDNRNGDYSTGIFIVNEGPFGGTGSITWHNPATGETVQDVYEKENCGASLGQFVQSLTFHNGYGYIVVNGDNKIVVIDARTFKYLGVIEGLQLPRFLQPIDNQYAYVSQWGSDGVSGSLVKVDLLSKTVVKTIAVGSGPEKMVVSGNTLFVANSGGYGVDSTIAEIDLLTDVVVKKHPVTGKNPSSLVLENQQLANPVYLCKGYYLDPVPSGNLNQLVGGTATGISTAAYADDLSVGNDGKLYFTGNSTIYKAEKSGNGYLVSALFDQNAYGLGLDAGSNLLYCADAKDFSQAGEVIVRTLDGATIETFSAGIAPGEVVIVK